MARKYFINLSAADPAEAFVTSFMSPVPVKPGDFYRESDLNVEFHFLRENGDSQDAPFIYADPATWTFSFGVGEIGLLPTAGTFTITDGPQTTAAIDFNATALVVQAAVRLALTTNYATATVSGNAGGPWTLTAAANGALATITATPTALQPANSTVIISNTQDGTASLPEQFVIELARALPIGRSSGWTALSSATVTPSVDQAGSGSANKVFKVAFNADAFAGDITLNFTGDTTTAGVGPIAYNATAEEIVAAFEQHVDVEDAGVAVFIASPGVFYVTCTGTGIKLSNTPALATLSNTLQVPLGFTGTLNSNTAGVTATLNGSDDAAVLCEARLDTGSGGNVVATHEITLFANLIRASQGVANALDPTLTASQLNQFLPLVTGYTGGGSTNLDGIDFSAVTAGRLFCFVHATDGLVNYQLRASTTAEAAPGIIHPDNYHAVTNAKVLFAV